jgi:endonuclease YncB( thermonuclease family)
MERGSGSASDGPAAELGTIRYVNLTADSEHGNYLPALEEARKRKKPIFANFVQWPG